jgi:hypothetical protein
MTAADGNYQISGTASIGRSIELKVQNDQHAYNISGSLEKPKVTPVLPAAKTTRAELRP